MNKIISLLALAIISLVTYAQTKVYVWEKDNVTEYTVDNVEEINFNAPIWLTGMVVKNSTALYVGENEKLTPTYSPDNASKKFVRWSSSNNSVATVDADGNVTAVAYGKADITAISTQGGFKSTCSVEVRTHVSGISLSQSSMKMYQGISLSLTPTITPSTAYDKSITWTTSDATVATVSKGIVTSKDKDGTAVITATTTDGNYVATCTVTVEGTIPTGQLGGEFSVSATKKVRFSSGNLQYHCKNAEFRFAEHQYDMIGADNEKAAADYDGYVDLFAYGTSSYDGKAPYTHHSDRSKYIQTDIAGTNYDWGVYNAITNGGGTVNMWRTMTESEWEYLLKYRTDAKEKIAVAVVGGVYGAIILPDVWVLPEGVSYSSDNKAVNNKYTVEQWEVLESAGAVFLPAAGCIYSGHTWYMSGWNGSNTYYCSYWGSTISTSNSVEACSADFYVANEDYKNILTKIEPTVVTRYVDCKFSVRLVQDVAE